MIRTKAATNRWGRTAGAGAVIVTGLLALAAGAGIAGAASPGGRTVAVAATSSTPAGLATRFTGVPPLGGSTATGPSSSTPTSTGASTGSGRGTGAGTPTRQKIETALADRQGVLAKLTTSVENSGMVSGTVQATLASQLAAETQGIDALAAQVPTEPATQLRATGSTMVHQYRVYLVMAPKVRIAERAERQGDAEQKVTAREATIEARIQTAQAQGRTVQDAQNAYENLVQSVTSAAQDTQAVDTASVLAVTPSGYPSDGGPITAARSDLHAAAALRPQIKGDIQTIRTDLAAGA